MERSCADGTRYHGYSDWESGPFSTLGKAMQREARQGLLPEYPTYRKACEPPADHAGESAHRCPHALVFVLQGKDRVPIRQRFTREPSVRKRNWQPPSAARVASDQIALFRVPYYSLT